jgi:starch synthase (maltosyl-transferring)
MARARFYRPNFFVNTPDINPVFLQTQRTRRLHRARRAGGDAVGPVGHLQRLRAVRGHAAARQGGISRFGEVRDAARDWRARQHRRRDHPLNRIRRENPALQTISQHRLPTTPGTTSHALLRQATPSATMHAGGGQPRSARTRRKATFEVPLWEFGLPGRRLEVEDLMRGPRFTWHGKTQHRARPEDNLPFAIWRSPCRRPENATSAAHPDSQAGARSP